MAINLLARSLLTASRPTGGLAASALTSANYAIGPRILGAQCLENQMNQWPLVNYVQNRGAARRGKRIERARLNRLNANKRRLLEAQVPKRKQARSTMRVDKDQLRFKTERQLDTTLPAPPEDNVYFFEKYRKKRFSFDEIIEFHRQAVHPDVLNQPDALISATIELNLKMKIKRKKFIEKIDSTLCYPHPFKYELRPRKIVAICRSEEESDAAIAAGAIIAGSMEVVDSLKKKQLTQRDFDHIVCHSDLLEDFGKVKGMKTNTFFPTPARGNIGENICELVRYFKDGIDYSLRKDSSEPEYGFIDCYFGKLDMSTEQLRENLLTLLQSINKFKPLNLADNKQFFQRVSISVPATQEVFLLKFWEIIDDYEDPDAVQEEEDEGGKQSVVRA